MSYVQEEMSSQALAMHMQGKKKHNIVPEQFIHALTAGDEELYEAVAAPLDVMGKNSFYLGEVGNGANMKLVREAFKSL